MKRLLLAVALATSALSGCAQLATAEAGATASEQRPYPSAYRNDHYYVP